MSQDTTEPNAADRLESGVAGLAVPEPSADTEALLLKLGFALPIIGVVLILVAYYNASGSAYVADQIPMLISGGVLGLGLVLLGLMSWLSAVLVGLIAHTQGTGLMETRLHAKELSASSRWADNALAWRRVSISTVPGV